MTPIKNAEDMRAELNNTIDNIAAIKNSIEVKLSRIDAELDTLKDIAMVLERQENGAVK